MKVHRRRLFPSFRRGFLLILSLSCLLVPVTRVSVIEGEDLVMEELPLRAPEGRARWKRSFLGFTVDRILSNNGKEVSGKITVTRPLTTEVYVDDQGMQQEMMHQQQSMAVPRLRSWSGKKVHRRFPSIPGKEKHRSPDHIILFTSDYFNASSRGKDALIWHVDQTTGDQKLALSMLEALRLEEENHFLKRFTVSSPWTEGFPGKTRDGDIKVGEFDLPLARGVMVSGQRETRITTITPLHDMQLDVVGRISVLSHRTGVLLLAHGGKQEWNEQVLELAAHVDKRYPTEVAFGMASRSSIEKAITRLIDRGATEIAAIPLFISSYSSVMRATEYLLGIRRTIPHRASVAEHNQQRSHGGNDALIPITLPVPLCMSRALDAHPLVAEILLDRARTLSRDPRREVVILVAHGPVTDEDNAKWLAHMRKLADLMRIQYPFKRIEVITLRDDAPRSIRAQATAQLRTMVRNARAEDYRVLIVPLLISFGGIEQGIKQRLKGLDYVMSEEGLLPDARLVEWVILSVEEVRQKLTRDAKDMRCLDSAIKE